FFDDIPWISIQPLFDLANNDSSAILHISLDPGNLPSGSYQSAFTFFTTQIGYMDRTLLPIHLDVVSDISEPPTPIPETFEVSQNYPNPFNPETHIRYGLPEPAKVTIDIFNILGQRVYHHQTALLPAGFHTFIWKGRSDQGHPLSSGVYFYQISDGKHSIIRKMVLMK
ncbi:MAG: T9SS C-terminal target domain-containing protein, partial [Methanobacteriota archaeon]